MTPTSTDNSPSSIPDGAVYAALIFDWDGTLVDSREVNFKALADAMADYGVHIDPEWYWPRQAIASPDMLVVWEQEFGPLPAPIPVIIDRCRSYVIAAGPHLVVNDDIAAVVRAAYARRQPIGIGSNASTTTIAAGLAGTGLAELFPVVVTWSDVAAGKPAPDIFLLVAAQLDVAPGKCLVYEDADEGVAAALAAGMDVYNVRTGALYQPAIVE